MQLGAIAFIVLEKALYMFRVLFAPIIRSVLKLYMQSLVRCPLPIIFQQTGSDFTPLHDCTSDCMYSFKTLLMMGAKSTRNMLSAFSRTIKTIATNCITLVVLLINWMMMMHGSTIINFILGLRAYLCQPYFETYLVTTYLSNSNDLL